jgi:hypothetical protein
MNSDKHDKRVDDLEYITPRANTRLALEGGLEKRSGPGRCLSPSELREIRDIVATVPRRELPSVALGKRSDTSHETIRQIRLGKRWPCLD